MTYALPEHKAEGFSIFTIPKSISHWIEKQDILRYLDPAGHASVSAYQLYWMNKMKGVFDLHAFVILLIYESLFIKSLSIFISSPRNSKSGANIRTKVHCKRIIVSVLVYNDDCVSFHVWLNSDGRIKSEACIQSKTRHSPGWSLCFDRRSSSTSCGQEISTFK